jgi:hypothetical protein
VSPRETIHRRTVILSAAKNLSHCPRHEILRSAQDDDSGAPDCQKELSCPLFPHDCTALVAAIESRRFATPCRTLAAENATNGLGSLRNR